MKISRVVIENIRSFKEETVIDFEPDLNILIGPNGGGKSNLLDILTIVMRGVFVKPYSLARASNGTLNIHNPNPFSPLRNHLDKFWGNEKESSIIQVIFKVTRADLENMRKILENEDYIIARIKQCTNWNSVLGNPEDVFQQLKSAKFDTDIEIKYKVDINVGVPQGDNSRISNALLLYMKFFELFSIILGGKSNLKPIYLHFIPFRVLDDAKFKINISDNNFTLPQLYQQYINSVFQPRVPLIQVSLAVKAQRKRQMEAECKDKGYGEDWESESKDISGYLKQLGYGWDLNLTDLYKNIYELNLLSEDKNISPSRFSSGEKELLNFIVGILGLDIEDAFIIIDEPELHLHPKWQKLLIDVFKRLSREKRNQFIVCTHSPVFVDEDTISNVIRVFKDEYGSSKIFKASADIKRDAKVKDLLQVINTYNNEKMFFADKVVLVEGISDKFVFQKLFDFKLGEKSKRNERLEVVEVVNVDGKHNFNKYTKILRGLGIKYYIIADFDYAKELAKDRKRYDIADKFEVNYKSINDAIKRKSSKDAISLLKSIDEAIRVNKITESLKETWEYIKSRHLVFDKSNLSEEALETISRFVEELENENIFLLCDKNEFDKIKLEDFLPDGYKAKEIEVVLRLLRERCDRVVGEPVFDRIVTVILS